MNIDKLEGAIQSGVIPFPQGLTRDERRQYISEQLSFLKQQHVQQIFENLGKAYADGTLIRRDGGNG